MFDGDTSSQFLGALGVSAMNPSVIWSKWSKSLQQFNIEAHGDLGIPFLRKPPCVFWCLLYRWLEEPHQMPPLQPWPNDPTFLAISALRSPDLLIWPPPRPSARSFPCKTHLKASRGMTGLRDRWHGSRNSWQCWHLEQLKDWKVDDFQPHFMKFMRKQHGKASRWEKQGT